MNWLKSDIAIFLYKVAGIYLLWYLLYELWLLPDGRLDAWLCLNVAQIGYDLLELFEYEAFLNGRHVGVAGTSGVLLVDGCSGIAAIGLFVGFVIAYPGRWVPRIFFIITGIGIIYLVNVIRIIALTITLTEWPNLFDFMHDYSSIAIFYIIIFGMWMIWANNGEQKSSPIVSKQPAATA